MVRSGSLDHRAGSRAVSGGAVAAFLISSAQALASGGPENAVLIIDPGNPISVHVGNYYKNARNIPDSNVLYMAASAASSYQEWVNINQAAFLAALNQRGLANHIDYVIMAPSSTFYVSAPGLVTDGCFNVTRFSIGSAFAMSFISDEILVGGIPVSFPNRYYSATDAPHAFDSSLSYLNGIPSNAETARRYYIGALLGHTSVTGNTVPELLANIDRSVAADGTRPLSEGTFYYMNNTADAARNVRQPSYQNAVNSLNARGATGEQLVGVLPPAGSICHGVMTGTENFNLATAGITIRPGAFCDHLTSYAATFDIGAQTKVSQWIAFGASGSAGTVEEPCNYREKFPHPRLHVWYAQGLTLGEAYLRSMQYFPFQSVFYGDPLTRAHARIPVINISDFPVGEISGTIRFSPTAKTTNPGAVVNAFDLLVDGALVQSITNGQQFTLDTTTLVDGYHDIRVIGRDNAFTKTQGRWVSTLATNNSGHSATLEVAPASGNLLQQFAFTFGAQGGTVREVRLLQGGRVVAASTDPTGSVTLFGQTLGAGTSKIVAEVLYADGRRSKSAPVSVTVESSGATGNGTPRAFSYTKHLLTPTPYVVELPAAFPQDLAAVTYTVLSQPTQATILTPGVTGPYRIIRPNAGATGSEQITFQASHGIGGPSNIGTITLVYTMPVACPPDWNLDGVVNSQDFFDFLADFFENDADFNQDNVTNSQDFFDFLADFFEGC